MSSRCVHRALAAVALALLLLGVPVGGGAEGEGVYRLAEAPRPPALKVSPDLILGVAAARALPAGIPAEGQAALQRVVGDLRAGKQKEATAAWGDFARRHLSGAPPGRVTTLVHWVLRKSYLETRADLALLANKARHLKEQKEALREHLVELRRAAAGLRPGGSARMGVVVMERRFEEGGPAVRRASPVNMTKGQLEVMVREVESRLKQVGEDAQLANIDMQNALQKRQQTLQMMSNVSKMLHDTAMAVIRGMRG